VRRKGISGKEASFVGLTGHPDALVFPTAASYSWGTQDTTAPGLLQRRLLVWDLCLLRPSRLLLLSSPSPRISTATALGARNLLAKPQPRCPRTKTCRSDEHLRGSLYWRGVCLTRPISPQSSQLDLSFIAASLHAAPFALGRSGCSGGGAVQTTGPMPFQTWARTSSQGPIQAGVARTTADTPPPTGKKKSCNSTLFVWIKCTVEYGVRTAA
jgi:hypothetical protein